MEAHKKTDANLIAERNAIVERHLPLAYWVARQYFGRGLDDEDLRQVSVMGLMRAVELFDPSCGTKLSTYAVFWCRQAVGRAIRNQSRTIRVPGYVADCLSKLRRADDQRDLTESEVAARNACRTVSVDHLSGGEDGTSWEPIDNKEEGNPFHRAAKEDSARLVQEKLGQLPEDVRDLVTRRFGIGCRTRTLREIGERLGVTRERVRQMIASAIKEMGR